MNTIYGIFIAMAAIYIPMWVLSERAVKRYKIKHNMKPGLSKEADYFLTKQTGKN